MTERERLIELLKKAPYGANAITLSDKHKDSILGEIADYLLGNGVIVIDGKTALSMFAGAYAIGNDDFLMMGDYGKVNADKKLNVIPYRKAAERLRQIAEKALKESEQK